VLDAGLPGDWRAFSSALSRLGRSLSDIDAVLITHHHPDHAGNAERIRETGTGPRSSAGRTPRTQSSRSSHSPYWRQRMLKQSSPATASHGWDGVGRAVAIARQTG
jgi:glyoxylase-like metal-dependent hydrolase (beta-lactamase superfamily II)